MRNTLPLFLFPLCACGRAVLPEAALLDAGTTPDAQTTGDARVTDAGIPDAGPTHDAADPDAAPCVAYDFETTGRHLVSRFDLAHASISGSNMLTWLAGDFGRRGFGILGGPTAGLDTGETIMVVWDSALTFTRFGYYPATRPARLLLTWADGSTSLIERDGNGGSGIVFGVDSPVTIQLEATSPEPIVLRSLSYCP